MKKAEFSKLVLGAAVITWLAGAVFGAVIVTLDNEQLSALLTYIGAPTATSFGFYAWKAKNENIIKYNRRDVGKIAALNKTETEGAYDCE